MSTYVIGDLHGQFEFLKQCLVKSNFDYNKDTLIQLGAGRQNFTLNDTGTKILQVEKK